jgi:hypothetical protein
MLFLGLNLLILPASIGISLGLVQIGEVGSMCLLLISVYKRAIRGT